MKHKIFSSTAAALACLLALSGCGGSGVSQESGAPAGTEPKVYDNPASGIQFQVPEAWIDCLQTSENLELSGFECALDVRYTTPLGLELMEELNDPPANQTREELEELRINAVGQSLPVLCIIAEYEGCPDPEVFRYGYADEKPLGEFGGTTYTLLYNKTPDLSQVEGDVRETYQSILDGIDEMEASLVLTGHKALGSSISFDAETIGGQAIDSSVFEDYDLTAINIWATWCTPCTGELPELQKVYESLPENVNFLGICTDAGDEPELAAKMVEELGLIYENIAANTEMEEDFLVYITSLPTTVFVDSQGNFVGNPMIGVPYEDVADTYRYTIEKRLALALEGGRCD